MSNTADVPHALSQVTPAWLTQILRESGAIKNAAAASYDMERVGVGVGFLGEPGRVTPPS